MVEASRRVTARKPRRERRNVAGLTTAEPPAVEVLMERARSRERVVEVVLIAATEDGECPL